MTGECYNEELLAAYVAGACSAEEAAGIEGHVRDCAACRDWLDEAGSNEAIAGSVLQAIDGYARTTPPPLDAPEGETDDEALVGRKIGGFLVERVIARGGMGTVYLARQERPQRPVALKVMRSGLLSRSARRRFEYESQVLATLRHPNIAQVYEAGVAEVSFQPSAVSSQPSGPLTPHSALRNPHSVLVPYFAMEYIPDARTITEYASATGLNTRQRLELFLQVCDAVHHGHQKGVIHRDLKPSNILVADEDGGTEPRRHEGTKGDHSPLTNHPSLHFAQAKVIDFGVARATDADIAATMHTHTGQLVGTLAYMSPEQCRADPQDIDTRSDVYSLGVVLYELLCGRLPYDVSRTNIVAAGRTICEQAPDRPSIIVRTVRGDVEKIVLKALEKDRNRRYSSADALAQDIRRYLAGEPIQASLPTAWAHLVRWTLRHPRMSTAVLCLSIAAAMVAGVLLFIWAEPPHRLAASSDYSEIRVLTFSGREMHAWRTGPRSDTGAGPLNRWIVQPRELESRRLVIVGYLDDAGNKYEGKLCAYDLDRDLDTPLWARGVSTDDLPTNRPREKYWGNQSVAHWDAFDIFPESPGEEIVAAYGVGPYSPRCIRIYDTAGKVLYQVWHDGSVADFQWLKGPRLLVCLSDNKAALWREREGGQSIDEQFGPNVVFALCPRLGMISRDFLDSERSGEASELSPAWYKCLWPLKEGSEQASWCGLNPHGDAQAEICVNIQVESGERGGFSFKIDELGEEIPGTRHPGDSYLSLASPPPLDMVRLGELPPVLPPSSSQPSGKNIPTR